MDLTKALKTALDFEQKGHNIYEETANKTENPIVEKTFRYLSNQELIHIHEIREYIKKLDRKHKIKSKIYPLKSTDKFFDTTVKKFREKTRLSDSDIKAHKTALELEKSSYKFYKQQYNKKNNKELKKFFRWLMEQENDHYGLIQKAYDFIKNPVGFYTEEEKWIAEGG